MKLIPIFLLVFLTACISSKQYEGPERPAEEIAILHNPNLMSPVLIAKINGKHRGIGYVDKFQLLSGDTTLVASYDPKKKPTPNKVDLECAASFIPVSFKAKAGRSYALKYELSQTQWAVWVQDAITNKVVSKRVVGAVKKSSGKNLVDIKDIL